MNIQAGFSNNTASAGLGGKDGSSVGGGPGGSADVGDASSVSASGSFQEPNHHCMNNKTWSLQKATEKCKGRRFCKFTVIPKNWVGDKNDPCNGIKRYLYIKYRCQAGKIN